ncbi:MAG: low temperature requirement protein A [Alcanivorax sp.]|nr:low temperature requirement protein A [Alcanivorax sp.]
MSRQLHPPRSRHHLSEHNAAKPTWLELFYDLVFVAVFIQIGNLLSHHLDAAGFLKVLVLFAPLWWVWANVAWYMNRFDVDDVPHRLLLLVQIFFIAWMGLSVPQAFGDHSTQFVVCYIGFRLTMIAMYLRSLRHAPQQRQLLIRHISHFHGPGALLWGLSLLLPPEQRPLVWVATFLWEAGNTLMPRFQALMRQFPVHTHHLVERFGTLIILVLGETFIKSITVDPAPALSLQAGLFSALAITTFFGLWWLYFTAIDGEHAAESTVCVDNPIPWIFAHLPLGLVLIISAVAKSKLFQSVITGHGNTLYAALYLATLAAFFLLLCVVAGDRRRGAVAARLGTAGVFTLLVPVAWLWPLPPMLVAAIATGVIAIMVARDVALQRG